jgi:hypothetical protein
VAFLAEARAVFLLAVRLADFAFAFFAGFFRAMVQILSGCLDSMR